MSARVAIDATSATPPFEQIRAQIAGLVAAGELLPGDALPTVRGLAADLQVAVGTVARAYRELEAAGIVATRRRTGTVVAGAPGQAPAPQAVVGLRPLAARLVAQARALGVGEADVLDLVQGELRRQG